MKKFSLAFLFPFCALTTLALAQGAPKLQFDKMVYDFGKVTNASTVNGKFICKNAGDGVLKLQQPQAQCGCTVPRLEKDTLNPGESCDLAFSISLVKGIVQKTITVPSNDPQTPSAVLTIKADYAPLYDWAPQSLYANVPFGGTVPNRLTVTRNDGQPLKIQRLDTTKPWLTATVDRSGVTNEFVANIVVEVKTPATTPSPPTYNEVVHIYAGDATNSPIASIPINGRFLSELDVSPQSIYWPINDTSQPQPARQVVARLAGGKGFKAQNVQSSLKDVNVELVPIEDGKAYTVVAKLARIPEATVSGMISFDTSVASQPKVQIPVTIAVPLKPVSKTVVSAPPASIARPPEQGTPPTPTPLPR